MTDMHKVKDIIEEPGSNPLSPRLAALLLAVRSADGIDVSISAVTRAGLNHGGWSKRRRRSSLGKIGIGRYASRVSVQEAFRRDERFTD